MRRDAGHCQDHFLARYLGIDGEVATVALGVLGAGLLQGLGQRSWVVAQQGRYRRGGDLVGGQAAGECGDFRARAGGRTPMEARHNGAVAFSAITTG